MKMIRFALAGRVQHGSLEGDQIHPLEGEVHAFTAVPGARTIPLGSVKLVTPTAAGGFVRREHDVCAGAHRISEGVAAHAAGSEPAGIGYRKGWRRRR